MPTELENQYFRITAKGILAFHMIDDLEKINGEKREDLLEALDKAFRAIRLHENVEAAEHLADIFCLCGFCASEDD